MCIAVNRNILIFHPLRNAWSMYSRAMGWSCQLGKLATRTSHHVGKEMIVLGKKSIN